MFSKWNEIMVIVTSSIIGFYESFIVTSWPSLLSHAVFIQTTVPRPFRCLPQKRYIYENYPEWSDTVLWFISLYGS